MTRQPGATNALRSQDDWEWLLEDMLKLSRTSDNGLRSAFGLLSQSDILSIFLSGLLSTGRKYLLTFIIDLLSDARLLQSYRSPRVYYGRKSPRCH